jgi:mitogen-activated protein kinase-activated protein kinase 2
MGQRKTKLRMESLTGLKPKTNPIRDDYEISSKKLGIGINGSVLSCFNRNTREEFALKVLHDSPKARREIILHLKACQDCPYIVQIVDVYENMHKGQKVLCVVMEWYGDVCL